MDLKVLLELQLADTHLNQIEHKRAALVERKALVDHDAKVKNAQHRVSEIGSGLKEMEAALADAEAKGAECDNKRARLEAQLKTVIAPREAEALQHEITTIREERDQADSAALDLMEQIVEQTKLRAETEEHVASLSASRSALESALQHVDGALAAEAVEIRAKRDTLAAQAGDDLKPYELRRKSLGGIAVAALDGHVCSGCHLDISVGELSQLRAVADKEDPECPNCGRWLVL